MVPGKITNLNARTPKEVLLPGSRRDFRTDSRQTVGICQLAIHRGFGNKPNAGITLPDALTCIKAFGACRMRQFTKKGLPPGNS
jgi:hypothetical protein